MNVDKFTAAERLQFCENIISSYSERDNLLADNDRIEDQDWSVIVPKAWEGTAKTQHSSMPKDIIANAIGTLVERMPVCIRTSPDDDEKAVERAETVRRHLQARFDWDKKHALPGKDAWEFTVGQIIRAGAACVGSIFAPHNWANYEDAYEKDGRTPKRKYWRDSAGKAVPDDIPEAEQAKKEDREASSRYIKKVVDDFRKRAAPPIVHRFVPINQCYPVFTGGEMSAMVIRRYASPMEISESGFRYKPGTDDPKKSDRTLVERDIQLTELWTKNKYHYFVGGAELRHREWGKGVETGYGFVPFAYQVGMEGGDLEWGTYGLPLLSLVKHNLVMLDTLLTFRYNALHLAGFTSFQVIHDRDSETVLAVAAGDEMRTYEFRPGLIHDLGPGRHIEPFVHPGLSTDFRQALQDERNEIRRIIPDVLTGIAESSGYNSAIATKRAMAKFTALWNGGEHLLERVSEMDMHHISERVPGPIYLNYADKRDDLSRRPPRMSRVSIDARDVDDYYEATWAIDREVDTITLGNWAVQVHAAGHMNREWVFDKCGGVDFAQSEMKRLRDEFKQDPTVRSILIQRAIERFNLKEEAAQAAAKAMIQTGPDGTPMVQTPTGLAGPGAGVPALQGGVGAALGGMNPASTGPNMGSVGNPNIAMPAPGVNRMQRRGGNPGAPQLQGMTKPGVVPG